MRSRSTSCPILPISSLTQCISQGHLSSRAHHKAEIYFLETSIFYFYSGTKLSLSCPSNWGSPTYFQANHSIPLQLAFTSPNSGLTILVPVPANACVSVANLKYGIQSLYHIMPYIFSAFPHSQSPSA